MYLTEKDIANLRSLIQAQEAEIKSLRLQLEESQDKYRKANESAEIRLNGWKEAAKSLHDFKLELNKTKQGEKSE